LAQPFDGDPASAEAPDAFGIAEPELDRCHGGKGQGDKSRISGRNIGWKYGNTTAGQAG